MTEVTLQQLKDDCEVLLKERYRPDSTLMVRDGNGWRPLQFEELGIRYRDGHGSEAE